MSAGQTVQDEVFRPDAGVKEVRLMPGDEKSRVKRWCRLAGLGQVPLRRGQDFFSGAAAELGEGMAGDCDAGGREPRRVGVELVGDLGRWRVGEELAVLGRGPVAGGHALGPQHSNGSGHSDTTAGANSRSALASTWR